MKIIDLTFPLENGMPSFPSTNHQKFESSMVSSINSAGRETRRFVCGSHCGTHIDAMKHFLGGDGSIDKIPLERLLGEAWLINMGELKTKTIISKEDIENKLPKLKVEKLILRTDWSRHWKTAQYFKDWPSLSHDAAKMLVEKGIKLLAMDFPSPDTVYCGNQSSMDSPNHKFFFMNDVILVEYLCNLDKLKEGKIFFAALPLKLSGFDGSPARIVSWEIE